MKISEVRLKEGFLDTLMNLGGDTPKVQPSTADVENKAMADFKNTMASRAVNAFNNAWKNNGIDLSGSSIGAPVATAAGLGLTPGGQPASTTQASQPAQPSPAAPATAAAPTQQSTASPNVKMTYQGKPAGGTSSNLMQPAKGQTTKQPGIKYSTTIPPKATPAPAPAAAPAAPTAPAAKAAPKTRKVKQPAQTVRIGNQKLDPNNPAHAKIIQQAQRSAKPRLRQNPTTKKWEPVTEELLSDSKFASWNRMLHGILNEQSTPGGQSPSEFMYLIVKQMLKGYNFEKVPGIKKQIDNALVAWEKAIIAQINKANGKFDGKFDSNTQAAFDNLLDLVASTAFATLAPKQSKAQQKPTP